MKYLNLVMFLWFSTFGENCRFLKLNLSNWFFLYWARAAKKQVSQKIQTLDFDVFTHLIKVLPTSGTYSHSAPNWILRSGCCPTVSRNWKPAKQIAEKNRR